MKRAGLISIAIGIFGCALAITPWLYLDKPGVGALLSTCLGAIFVGIARADLLSDFLERGNPGDELLNDYWSIAKRAWRKLKDRLRSNKKP